MNTEVVLEAQDPRPSLSISAQGFRTSARLSRACGGMIRTLIPKLDTPCARELLLDSKLLASVLCLPPLSRERLGVIVLRSDYLKTLRFVVVES